MKPLLGSILIILFFILFLSFLTVKLDQTVKWNWFITFIPLFLLQLCFTIDSIILIVRNFMKSKREKSIKLTIFLSSILLLFIFEILLCLKLEYYQQEIKLTYVSIPLWLILSAASVYILRNLIQ
jgi:hypothetical protein